MRELVTMWRRTRMVVLVAVIAAVYAAVLIPFKGLTIVPGITSVRPANVFPVIFGIMFGPAAAWGAAVGNLIGDIFGGTFGPGSAGGFLGNFFFGLLGYKLWNNLGVLSSGEEPDFRSETGRQVVEFVVVAATASVACAVIISWITEALGLFPFTALAPIITVNNTLAAVVLGPPLLYLTYPRIKEMGLLYTDVLRDEDLPDRASNTGAFVVIVASVVWLGVGLGAGDRLSGTGRLGLGVVAFLALAAGTYLAGQRLQAVVAG